MIHDTSQFLVVLAIAAAAPLVALGTTRMLRGAIVPITVIELVLGAALGPHGFGIARPDPTVGLLGEVGLAFLFFFAGYEIDFARIQGTPVRLALTGWFMSVAIAYLFAKVLTAAGGFTASLLAAAAMSTTAIGAILPVLRDTKLLDSPFGASVMSTGAVGELGPVLVMTLLLSAESETTEQAIVLAAFFAIAVAVALLASGISGHAWHILEASLHTSGQLLLRLTITLLLALVTLASSLGIDVVLGAFLTGAITRYALRGQDVTVFESKLEAVGFGLLIPFFFIRSGMNLDLSALAKSQDLLLRVPLFLVGFLATRGLPILLLYRRQFGVRDRVSLALLSSTQLPLVVAITSIAVSRGVMRPSTGVELVTAGVLSVLVFPTSALLLKGTTLSTSGPRVPKEIV